MINDLARLIEIDTSAAPAENGAPFGKNNRKALDLFVRIAQGYGLRTGTDEGYAAWAEYGDGKGLTGILCHLDVVPAGNGWSTDPFRLTVENGMLYGRGVSDDKGPAVACLHALARLAKEKTELNGRVRLIVGCNEEEGSKCIKHYVEHCEIPVAAFTPDSDFPVTASEKGILHLLLSLPLSEETADAIAEVNGGEKANVVPDFCKARVTKNSPLYSALTACSLPADILKNEKTAVAVAEHGCDLSDISIYFRGDGIEMTTRGSAAHASTPRKGSNAVSKMLALLSALLPGDETLRAAANVFCDRAPEQKLGVACADETGELTVNVGVCRKRGRRLELTLDIRIPACTNAESVAETISGIFRGSDIKILQSAPALSADENGLLVRTLMNVYREYTGDTESKPLHIGGGTYAKELPCCVAFGAVFPGRDTHMHDADECYPVEDFYKLAEIYRKAIVALDKAYFGSDKTV